eukprot:GHRQ01039401.1.p1 GENE.GHRQ01039401.1~~GHRQ01039401.1.p1  ORF type:complete len:128 (-),score=34.79 GHRQ01039401.1:139-522(-)
MRAVQTLVSRGVTDPARVSVGGHSYGAFMAGEAPSEYCSLRHRAAVPRRLLSSSRQHITLVIPPDRPALLRLFCPAANLLAHCPELFAAGIARSGAYNRTLTPFGFQSEERTLWQAPDTYAKMSPFM